MGARGRKSADDLSVVSNVVSFQRPRPPAELTDEQAEEWKAVVSRMPADWFGRETHSMLAQLCRHVVSARRVAQLITAAEEDADFDVQDYDRLLKCQERESRCIASLSVKLRLAHTTSYDREKKRPAQVKKPWES